MKPFLLTLALAFSLCAKSQPNGYYMHHLSTESKMPVGNVHAVYVDKEGYVWYSTEENLCRSNGYQIDVFCSDSRHPNLLQSNFILDIAEDNDHHIWFGSSKGVYLLDKRDYAIHPVAPDKTGDVECDALIALRDGTVWISSPPFLLHLDSQEKQLNIFHTRQGKYVNSFYEDREQNLWMLEFNGDICRYDKTRQEFIHYKYDGNQTIHPQRMVEDVDNGCYWVSTWGGGIYKFIPNTLNASALFEHQDATSVSGPPTGTKAEVIDLLLDKKKNVLWVTSMDGLHAFSVENGTLSEISLDGFLPDGRNIVDRMFMDSKGNIWVSAFSPHTFIIAHFDKQMRRNRMDNIFQKTGNSVIGDFAITQNDKLWLWDPRIGLELHDLETGITALASDQADDSRMHGSGVITPVHQGQGFWMASDERIIQLSNVGMNIVRTPFATIPGAHMFGISDPGDGFLWVASSLGLKKVKKDAPDNITQVTDSADAVYRIAVDKAGNFFFHSQEKGLMAHLKKSDSFIPLLNTSSQDSSSIEQCTCMTLDTQGILWYGTNIGRVYSYNPSDNSPELNESLGNESGARILDIKRDSNGHLWSVTSQMVKEWNPKSGLSHTMYGSAPSIDMDYFRTMAVYKDSVCLAGSMGYCMVASSSMLNKVSKSLQPRVSSFVVDGEKCYVGYDTDEIDITAAAAVVQLNITVLDHINAGQTQYAYRLCKKGLFGKVDESGKWNVLSRGENVVTFTSLPKGDYVLQLKCTDAYGTWNAPAEALTIHRLPAWWESWWAYSLYVALALAALYWLFKAYSNRVRRKRMTQMEEELTEMKFKFFTNISHELRTPLTMIMLPLENMMKKSQSLSETDRSRLQAIHSNANELMQMINQLLDFRRMELGDIHLNAKNGNISEFMQSAVESFRPLADSKNITLSLTKPDKDIYMNFDHSKLHHVVWNLMSNALKFTGENGSVTAALSRNDDNIVISIKDTGVGIDPSQLPHVFDRYYQVSSNHAEGGSGIGLHLVRELVHLHGGEVNVESEPGKGSNFWFTIPFNIPLADNTETAASDDTETETEPVEASDGTKTILLVEDNVEFRNMLSKDLNDEGFSVIVAGNGVEGLQQLKSHNVDIVISDVMMPEMDGFELCRQIKSDIQNSHVPIILLTAKTGDENRLEGYKMGADYYMTKPFSMEILLNRIEHLNSKKSEGQSSFQHSQENDVVGMTRSKIDEEFLQKAIEVMNEHIDDPNFNVDSFSSEMCVSRMTLYRKLHNLTGQSTIEFITTIRLKHAAKLLRETSLSIATISDQSGFSNPSYFAMIFKKMFGTSPKDYR